MNLLPVAHTIAKPNRNEKIILILIAAVYRMLCALQILRITAGRNEHLTGGRGRRLPVAIVLRFDRVGRRELDHTTKRNVHHNPVGATPCGRS